MKPYRQHHEATPGTGSGLHTSLVTEWAALHQRPATTAAICRWARTEPALTSMTSPGQIVDTIDDADDPLAHQLFAALLRLHQSGQQLAGRILLQAMLPGLRNLARRLGTTPAWDEDRLHLVVAEFWAVASTFPLERRTGHLPTLLHLQTLHNLTALPHRRADRSAPDTPAEPTTLTRLYDAAHTPADSGATLIAVLDSSPTADSCLDDLLAWAVSHGVLERPDAELLMDVCTQPHGHKYDRIVAAENISHQTARRRATRARQALIAAARDRLVTGADHDVDVPAMAV